MNFILSCHWERRKFHLCVIGLWLYHCSSLGWQLLFTVFINFLFYFEIRCFSSGHLLLYQWGILADAPFKNYQKPCWKLYSFLIFCVLFSEILLFIVLWLIKTCNSRNKYVMFYQFSNLKFLCDWIRHI